MLVRDDDDPDDDAACGTGAPPAGTTATALASNPSAIGSESRRKQRNGTVPLFGAIRRKPWQP
jgi:hypothetical protein